MRTILLLCAATTLVIAACSSSSSTQSTAAAPKPADSTKGKIKPYDKVITKEAVSDTGLFTVHRVDEKWYFEISSALFGKEMLLVSRIAKTPQIGYGGEENETQVVRWDRKDTRILLRTVSYENVAADSLPIARAVRASNFEEIIRAFPIASYSKDSNVVIEVTDMLTSDVGILTPGRGVRTQIKIGSLDKDRSFVEYIRSYPTNVEMENVLTYSAEQAPQNPSTRTATFSMHHSLVLLPEKPMMPRLADPRVGFFSLYKTDYGRPEPEATSRQYILRWRLEPKDTAAFLRGELVEPIKPITWYIDPATPVQWRPWLKRGVEDWNVAFEAAGFKNAIRCIDPPTPEEDPEWSPEDARYSVIRYYASPVKNAYGPNVHDPRSGEIIESDIGWFHNILKLQSGWFFAQAVSDPKSHKLPYSDSLMGRLIQTVAAHEVGHTLGLPHNMRASNAYPVDSLRSKTFCAEYGTAPTIMDYARYNYIAQPGDDVDVMPKVGPYDKFVVKWGYRPIIGATTSDDELDTLRAWAKVTETNKMLRFGAQQWITVDPTSQMEDLGDDAIKATTYGIMNLKRAMGYLYDATFQRGENFDQLSDSYNDILGQFDDEVGHVAQIPGGVIIDRKVFGSEGPVYSFIPVQRQKDAVKFVSDNVFTTPTWLIDERVARLLTPTDVAQRISNMQRRTLRQLVSTDKLVRLLDQEARFPDSAWSAHGLLMEVENALFTEITAKKPTDYYRRALQRSYVQQLISYTEKPTAAPVDGFAAFLRGPEAYNTDVRALARKHLRDLQTKLKAYRSADVTSQAHAEDLRDIIEKGLSVQ